MMDESAISLFSYFFTEPPLCWCTSSLSYVFSEQPLTWATSSLTMPWAASQLARLYSFRNPILLFVELLQGVQQPPAAILQSRLPETSQHHSCFAANQVDQRSRSANNGDSTTQIRRYSDRDSFLSFFWWHPALAAVWCTFCRPDLPKVLRTPQFFLKVDMPTKLLLQSFSLFVNNFPRSRPAAAETQTLLWWPQEPRYPRKHKVSRPRVFSPVNSHASELLHSPTTWWWVVDMMMWLTWCCGC